MLSDFRKKKLVYAFSSFSDEKKKGFIEKKDFEQAAVEIANMRGWAAGSAEYKEVEDVLLKIWDLLQSHADKDKDGRISEDDWMTMLEEYAKNPSAPLEWQRLYCKLAFDLVDAGGDGVINGEQFSSVCASYGVDKEEALVSFSKMAKGKPSITWADYQLLWNEYFMSDDPDAAGNYIFGKSSF